MIIFFCFHRCSRGVFCLALFCLALFWTAISSIHVSFGRLSSFLVSGGGIFPPLCACILGRFFLHFPDPMESDSRCFYQVFSASPASHSRSFCFGFYRPVCIVVSFVVVSISPTCILPVPAILSPISPLAWFELLAMGCFSAACRSAICQSSSFRNASSILHIPLSLSLSENVPHSSFIVSSFLIDIS